MEQAKQAEPTKVVLNDNKIDKQQNKGENKEKQENKSNQPIQPKIVPQENKKPEIKDNLKKPKEIQKTNKPKAQPAFEQKPKNNPPKPKRANPLPDKIEPIQKTKKAKKTEQPKIQPQIEIKTGNKSEFYPTYNDFISCLESWKEPLKAFINPPNNKKMESIFKFVKEEYSQKLIYPPKEKIFTAFKLTTFDKLKVVILGQDPYPSPGQAMGLSFSVPKNIKVPKSLENIYKCLKNDKKLNFVPPKHGDLTSWAEQGVFMINATLTVVAKSPNSHQKNSGWDKFTDYVIEQISSQKEHVVFFLWGNFAQAKEKLINGKKHLIIKNIHPSPLAASKGDFTKSEQFSQCNEYLKANGIEEINWNISN